MSVIATIKHNVAAQLKIVLSALRGLIRPNGLELPITRIVLRAAFALLFFWLIDTMLMHAVASPLDKKFEHHYRFQEGTDISPLKLYIRHIRISAQKTRPKGGRVIVFLGSSPTYGHRIKNAENTYPYSFETEANEQDKGPSALKQVKVYNLASNGQLVADQYYIAQSLIDSADAFIIQLNYHTFNPGDKKRPVIRYTDLPERLGVVVPVFEAKRLGKQKQSDLQAAVSKTLTDAAGRYSFVYANRDYITASIFGDSPKDTLFNRLHASLGIRTDDKDKPGGPSLFGESNKPFELLSNTKKILIIKRCSDLYDFDISMDDSEIYYLQKLSRLLAEHKKPALFFITPLNVEALDEYGIFNWDKYDQNANIMRSVIEKNGLKFLDANAVGNIVVKPEQFFDISHTLDSGGQTFGAWLAHRSKGYIWGSK